MYLHANNLYSWAMSQYLPTGNFRWMKDKEINEIDLRKYKADGKKGLIIEVDPEYPRELHNLHNDYPVAPEKQKYPKICYWGTEKDCQKYKISIGQVNKLIPTVKERKIMCCIIRIFSYTLISV